MTYKPELSDTTFTIKQLFDEVNSRMYIPPFWWAGQPEMTKGDNCDCVFCRRIRKELVCDLHLAYQKETCVNVQHRNYCEKHNRFYHPMDDDCEECRAEKKPKPTIIRSHDPGHTIQPQKNSGGYWTFGFGPDGIAT